MPKPPKPNTMRINGALHAVDLVASTGTLTTSPNVFMLLNYCIVIDGPGAKRWAGRVIQGTTPGSGITSWDFEVFCIRGGRNPSLEMAVATPPDVGPENVTVTIISPTPNSMQSDISDPVIVTID